MKQDYSIKDILNAVDNILKVKSTKEPKKEIIEKFLAANKPHDWIKYYKMAPKI